MPQLVPLAALRVIHRAVRELDVSEISVPWGGDLELVRSVADVARSTVADSTIWGATLAGAMAGERPELVVREEYSPLVPWLVEGLETARDGFTVAATLAMADDMIRSMSVLEEDHPYGVRQRRVWGECWEERLAQSADKLRRIPWRLAGAAAGDVGEWLEQLDREAVVVCVPTWWDPEHTDRRSCSDPGRRVLSGRGVDPRQGERDRRRGDDLGDPPEAEPWR